MAKSEAQTFISNLDEEQLETPEKIDSYFVNENSLTSIIVKGTFENNAMN